MSGNADIEQRWIDAWSDLIELAADDARMRCLLPDGEVVDVEAGKAWLQATVYAGAHVTVGRGWASGRRVAVLDSTF